MPYISSPVIDVARKRLELASKGKTRAFPHPVACNKKVHAVTKQVCSFNRESTILQF